MSPSLKLLGTLAVESGGVEERLPLERPVSLLVYLAVRGGWVDRRELAYFYRPDAAEAQALAYLRKLIHRARLYPWAARLEAEPDAVRWRVATDLARFTEAVESQQWAAALEAYGGKFLGGASIAGVPGFSAWQELEEQTLEAAWLRASERRAGGLEREGRLDEAIAVHNAVLAVDPFAEANVQALLRLLGAAGRRSEALTTYEAFRRILAEEFGAEPLETTEALADALRHSKAGRSTLPSPSTPLVGRRQELAALRDLLNRDDARLVTLLGLGGSGKTRIAIDVARWAEAAGEDVRFVSLAAVTPSGRVTEAVSAAIIEALGLEWQAHDAEATLIAGLRSGPTLLVLDNFEGALEAAPLLGRLLEAAPELRLLVTSREPLRLREEWLLDVGGLAVPPEPDGDTHTDIATFEAVELFTQHAARIAPWFAPEGADLEAIAEICRRLEGLPLAIELAASWSRVLSPPELLDQLAHEPQILTSQSRDVPPRHRSLWSVFDHVWERLGEQERSALPKLAVFEGGFDLEAAQAVTGTSLADLLRLTDLKLMRRTAPGRFALHQLVRQYALQQISEDELKAAHEVHSRYFCSLLERVTTDLTGKEVKAGLERVQVDLDNVMRAWETAVDNADVKALDAAREAFDNYFYYRARFETASELYARASRALDAASDAETRRVAARLLLHQADHERHRGSLPHSQELAAEALSVLEQVGGPLDVARALQSLGVGYMRLSAYAAAEACFSQVLEVAEAEGDTYLQASAHNGLAMLISYTEGDIPTAEEHYRASLRAFRQLGNLAGINGALINLGACRYDAHDFDGAERLWEEAAEMAAELGYKLREAVLHNNLGSLHEARGDLDGAHVRFEKSLALRREIGDVSGMAAVLHNLGRLAAERGQLGEARAHLDDALNIYLEVDERAGVAHTRSRLARVLSSSGLERQAREQARLALETALDIDSRVDILSSLLTVAILRKRAGKFQDAADLARTVAGAAAGNHEPLRVEAEAVIARAGAASEATEPVSAARLFQVAKQELGLLGGEAPARPSA